MKTSTTATTWEEKSEDIDAQILAKRIQKEARLRDIAEQSAFDFFIGGNLKAIAFRIIGLLVIGYLYFRSESFSPLGIWPIFAIGAFFEAMRANQRLDAVLELERMANQTNQANKPETTAPAKSFE